MTWKMVLTLEIRRSGRTHLDVKMTSDNTDMTYDNIDI